MNCWNLWKLGALDRRAAGYLGHRRIKVKSFIKYEVKKSRLVKALTFRGPRYADPPPPSSSLAACIKVRPVITSTRVENCSLAAALIYFDTNRRSAHVVHGAKAWNVQLCRSGGQRSRSHAAEVRFGIGGLAEASFSLPSVEWQFEFTPADRQNCW